MGRLFCAKELMTVRNWNDSIRKMSAYAPVLAKRFSSSGWSD